MTSPPVRPRILFLVSAHNSLSQCAYVALTELGHDVAVEIVDSAAAMEAAVARQRPELIICPMLKKIIPESIWASHRCLIVHPGPAGDRGPSSLDWAIELALDAWGVTVLEADGEVDGGDVWATRTFPIRDVGKSSLYRHEVRSAAIDALVEAVEKVVAGAAPDALDDGDPRVTGRARPLMKQDVRAIDWSSDTTDTVIRKIRAAEGHPGVRDAIDGAEFHLFDVHREQALVGPAGAIVAQRHGAICRATVDGAVWIGQLKQRFKLPATLALAQAGLVLERTGDPCGAGRAAGHLPRDLLPRARTGRLSPLRLLQRRDEHRPVQAAPRGVPLRPLAARYAGDRAAGRRRLLLQRHPPERDRGRRRAGGRLVAQPPRDQRRRARDRRDGLSPRDLGARRDAAAGGVPLALAADRVVARSDAVLNPYYRHMGGLYGSEYWTYLLPRRVGPELAARITSPPFTPVGTRRAVEIGLLDAAFGATVAGFHARTRELAERLASDLAFGRLLDEKRRRRARDERIKPLQSYRKQEMARSHRCFFGPDSGYHEARRRFVHKLAATVSDAPIDRARAPLPRLADAQGD